MPRPFSESVGSFCASESVVFLSRQMQMTCSCKSLGLPFDLSQTDLELRFGPNLMTQMDVNPPSLQLIISPFPQVQLARLAKYIAWTPLLVAHSSSAERWVRWIVSVICGETWIPSWERDSLILDLQDEFPALQRHSVRSAARN